MTININKSTAKKLGWWAAGLIVSCILTLLAVVFFLGKNSVVLDTAAATTARALAENAAMKSREERLKTAALEDKRLENRAAWKQLGVDGIALQDHDISDILKEVRKKHPLKEE